MGHFRRDERYAAHFQPSIYSEGVTGSYADYGDMTGTQYTHVWGGEGRALYKDAKEALDKAKDGDPLDSFQAEDLTLDQGIEDVSTESAVTGSVNNLGAYLQASIAMSWASRRLSGSLQQEAIELAEDYLGEGSCYACLVRTDASDIAAINLKVQQELRSLSDRAGFPAREGDLSYLLAMYGDTDARAAGGSPATKVDVEAILTEQELVRQRTPGGVLADTGRKTTTDLTCAAEVAKGLFTGKEPLSCDPDGALMKRWWLYKWGFRIAIGLIIVGYAGVQSKTSPKFSATTTNNFFHQQVLI